MYTGGTSGTQCKAGASGCGLIHMQWGTASVEPEAIKCNDGVASRGSSSDIREDEIPGIHSRSMRCVLRACRTFPIQEEKPFFFLFSTSCDANGEC